MAAELLHNRNRAFGLAAAIGFHAIVVAALILLAPRYSNPPAVPEPGLVAVPLAEPSPRPPPPPDDAEEGAAAPASRGATEAPSPPEPPRPLARPTPGEPAVDVGSAQASGAGAAPGSGAGQGGEGAGSGSGSGGSGRGSGSGRVTPPLRIAGELTNADYRRARPPEGAAGTVIVSFRVRTDGRVDGCTVLRSSGFAVFDEATCRLIQQRFRYRPARDEGGRPVDWEIRTDYTWAPR